MEVTILGVIIGSPATGEPDGRSHFSQNFEVIVQAALRDADFLCAIGRSAGALVRDKVIETDKSAK